MLSKKRQVVERPSGTGKIFKNNREIGTATYLLDVVQTIRPKRPYGDSNEVPGLREVRGQLKVADGQVDLREGIFILELTDGRRWEFFATNGDPVTGNYTVVRGGETL